MQTRRLPYSKTNAGTGRRPGPALWFAAQWTVFVAGLVSLQLFLTDQGLTARTAAVLAIFAGGAFSGALLARGFASLASRFRPQATARFAAMFIGLSAGTLGMTALIHFLQFRSYFASGHSDAFTFHWMIEMIFTSAHATYILTVEAAQLLLPWGLVLLFAASWSFARCAVPGRPA